MERVLVTTLTKRMAEDLTEYLAEHDVRVRYLHSDIDTVERVEIIRDLRLGEFDVLVGINLLREGLDMPEVSLVAILDADKEGFLRSERSLIQTIGRAARNVNGKAILYADRMTGSMQRAIGETERRRAKQIIYNEKHGITPRTIRKAVADVMEGAYAGGVPVRSGMRKWLKRSRNTPRCHRKFWPGRSKSWKNRCISTPRTWNSRKRPESATRFGTCRRAIWGWRKPLIDEMATFPSVTN